MEQDIAIFFKDFLKLKKNEFNEFEFIEEFIDNKIEIDKRLIEIFNNSNNHDNIIKDIVKFEKIVREELKEIYKNSVKQLSKRINYSNDLIVNQFLTNYNDKNQRKEKILKIIDSINLEKSKIFENIKNFEVEKLGIYDSDNISKVLNDIFCANNSSWLFKESQLEKAMLVYKKRFKNFLNKQLDIILKKNLYTFYDNIRNNLEKYAVENN